MALASVSLGATGGFLVVHRTIAGLDDGNAFDHAVFRAVARARGPGPDRLARALTWLGSVSGSTALTVSALAWKGRSPRSVAQILAGALGGIAAELFIKRLFRRVRPTLLPHLEIVRSTSFPSGHAMAAASILITLAFVAARGRRRAPWLAAAGALASAVGATRVHLGVHWPTDVVGGLALGTAWACAAECVAHEST